MQLAAAFQSGGRQMIGIGDKPERPMQAMMGGKKRGTGPSGMNGTVR
jgi:hypothetical protein